MFIRTCVTVASLVSLICAGCVARVSATGRAQGQGAGGGPTTTVTPPPITPGAPVQIAGTPVVRVGVNFEDLGGQGDRDYNDAVMCFEGRFNVDGTNVVSTEVQRVVASTSSRSHCRHRVRVEIHHADGTRDAPLTFDSRSGQQVPLELRVGSRLEVFTQTYEGVCSTTEMNMHEADNCRVLLDVCNTSGE